MLLNTLTCITSLVVALIRGPGNIPFIVITYHQQVNKALFLEFLKEMYKRNRKFIVPVDQLK